MCYYYLTFCFCSALKKKKVSWLLNNTHYYHYCYYCYHYYYYYYYLYYYYYYTVKH